MSKKRRKLFEIRKYRTVWAIKSPFTGDIIPAGNIGDVVYAVAYRGHRNYYGAYDTLVKIDGALDPDLSAYWKVTIEEDEYGEDGYMETTTCEYPAKAHNFKLDTATPTIVEAAYIAALDALPEGEREKHGRMEIVVLPTEQLNEQLNGSTND